MSEQPQQTDRVLTMEEVIAMMNDPNVERFSEAAPIVQKRTPAELQAEADSDFDQTVTGRNCTKLRNDGIEVTIPAEDLVVLTGLAVQQYGSMEMLNQIMQGEAPVMGRERITTSLNRSLKRIQELVEEHDLTLGKVVTDPLTGEQTIVDATEDDVSATTDSNDTTTNLSTEE